MHIYEDTIVIDEINAQRLVLNSLVGSPSGEMSEEDLIALVKWAGSVTLEYEMLQLALGGDMLVVWQDGEPHFRAPSDWERGELERYEELLSHPDA